MECLEVVSTKCINGRQDSTNGSVVSIPRESEESNVFYKNRKVPRNGFFHFMQQRKAELRKEGKILRMCDLAQFLDHEWQELPQNVKDSYRIHAIQEVSSDLWKQKKEKEMQDIKLRVDIMKYLGRDVRLETIPIVIISFITYVSTWSTYIPAEVGLTAFTIQDGIIGNFCSLVDPGAIPYGHALEARVNAKRHGVRFPPYSEKYQNYLKISGSMENFLEKYSDPVTKKTLVFCLRNEMTRNYACLNWLYSQIGKEHGICLYPLGELVRRLSFIGLAYRAERERMSLGLAVSLNYRIRNPDIPGILITDLDVEYILLHSMSTLWAKTPFVIPENYRLQKGESFRRLITPQQNGDIFYTEKSVDEFIKGFQHNYGAEAGCLYHFEMSEERKQLPSCALGVTNGYSYSVLSLLLTNFNVSGMPAHHFLDDSEDSLVEIDRRKRLLEVHDGYDNLP